MVLFSLVIAFFKVGRAEGGVSLGAAVHAPRSLPAFAHAVATRGQGDARSLGPPLMHHHTTLHGRTRR